MATSAGLPGGVRLCLFDLDYTLIQLMLDPVGVHVEVLEAAGSLAEQSADLKSHLTEFLKSMGAG